MDCAVGGDPVEDFLLGGAGDDGDLAIFCDGGYGDANRNSPFSLCICRLRFGLWRGAWILYSRGRCRCRLLFFSLVKKLWAVVDKLLDLADV